MSNEWLEGLSYRTMQLRLSKHLSQELLATAMTESARALGDAETVVTRTIVSNVESAKSRPSAWYIKLCSIVFDVSLNDLDPSLPGVWWRTSQGAQSYRALVEEVFQEYGPEIIVSHWPITRLQTPSVQKVSLALSGISDTALPVYDEILGGAHHLEWKSARSYLRERPFVNFVIQEEFEAIVYKPAEQLPREFRPHWPEWRRSWLAWLRRKVETGRCALLAIPRADLLANVPKMSLMMDTFCTVATVNDSLLLLRLKGTSDVLLSRRPDQIEMYNHPLQAVRDSIVKTSGDISSLTNRSICQIDQYIRNTE